MTNKAKKNLLLISLSCFFLIAFIAMTLNGAVSSTFVQAINGTNSLVISPSNPITNGYVRTTKGNAIYVKDDGVTWGNSNLTFANGGYIQTLSVIHGIQSVSVELSSGKLDLYHGYVEPTNLETPMYGADFSFSSSDTHVYTTNLPNCVRFRASENTVVSKITINFDCVSTDADPLIETLDDGLENSYIDAGAIKTYAATSYVADTASDQSSRALKTEYKGVTNNLVSLSTQMNTIKELTTNNPDFTNAVLTLKAKFSENIINHDISVLAVGSGWADSGYITMNQDTVLDNGWYAYSFDFTDVDFANKNSIIRIFLKPLGIDSGNKDTGYVLFDEIDYHEHIINQEVRHETIYDGLENLARDTSMENVYVKFDNEVTYGRASISSLIAKPKESIGSNAHYYVALSPAHQVSSGLSQYLSTNVSESIMVFEYKPINIQNPSTIYLQCLENWSNSASRTVGTTALSNGWYRFSYDLRTLGFTSPDMIRIKIGFDVESTNVNVAKIYFDNIRLCTATREDSTQGLENLSLDGGLSGAVITSIDTTMTATEASMNSLKCTINGSKSGWQGNRGVMFVCDNTLGISFSSGVLEAKFLFNGNFPTKEIRLDLVDAHWTGAWFKGIIPESLGNGWYQMSIDMSTLENWTQGTKYQTGSFDYASYPIRLGLSFVDITNAVTTNQFVYIDDMFYYKDTSPTSFALWEAYDTENVRQTDDTISNRSISKSNPLSFNDARNGIDSGQLMIKANSAISSFNFRPGTLRGSDGDVFPATCFEVLVAKYIEIGNTGETGKTGHMGTGWYPDALVPIDRIIKAGENTVASGKQQSIWINCKISTKQKAGTYSGNGILTVNGEDYVVPMEVVVYDFTLSDTTHNKTSFLIWFDRLLLAEPDEYTRTMRQTYYDFCIDRRISPDSNYDWGRWAFDDMDIYDSFADNFANYIMPNDKISTYRIPAEKTEASVLAYLTALVNRNKTEWDNGNHVNFFDKAIFILSDEPANPSWNNTEPQAWKDCKSVQTWIKSAQSSLGATLNNYPEIKAGLNSVRNVVTVGCDYEKITGGGVWYKNLLTQDYIGVPCPQFGKVDNATERSTYLSRFDKTWFYGCCNPQLPYPSYHMDTPLIGQRLITWMQYDYGFEGTLYFCVNMFSTSDAGAGTLRDVWTDPMVNSFAGDGQLLYPGSKYNIYGPITSMRLENIRNSMEDYELFYMMDQNIQTYNNNTGSNISSCRDLLASEFSQMFNGTQLLSRGHTSSSGYKSLDFEDIRTYLLERIEYCY